MKYPNILLAISKTKWFVEPTAFSAMLDIVNRVDLDDYADTYSLFHAADEDFKQKLLADVGEFEEGNDYTIINGKVGILFIDGPVVPRSANFKKFSGLTSISALTKEFKRLDSNPDIEEIVLFLDTPGGDVTGIHEFSGLVANSNKYVTAYVFGMAASAGYYIASAADEIISSVNGMVGSIGVVITLLKDNAEKRYVEITSSQSPYKRIDPESKKGIEEIRKVLDEMADNFINTVASNRGVSRDKVLNDFGKGNVVVSQSALEAGMIDSIASYEELLSSLGIVLESEDMQVESEFSIQQKKKDSMVVQSLIFSKKVHSRQSAISWAKRNNFRSDKVDETETSYRLRQKDPKLFKDESFRTKRLDKGVSSVMGKLKNPVDKSSDMSIIPKSKEEVNPNSKSNKGVIKMTLDQVLAEHPDLANELKEIKNAAFVEGAKSAREEIKQCAKYLGSEYPQTLQKIAIQYVKGERDLAAVEGAAAYFDMMRETESENQAIEETEQQEPTPSQEPTQISDDGVIRSAEDQQAAISVMKKRLGIAEREVN
jgi:ClpP class serine protease